MELYGYYDDDDDEGGDDGGGIIRMGEAMESLTSIIRRKQYEMEQFEKAHPDSTDPIRMALGYIDTEPGKLRVGRALSRAAYSSAASADGGGSGPGRDERPGSRRASFTVDVKRRSHSCGADAEIATFDDAAPVAGAMASLGADCVFLNVDYQTYGGDLTELRPAVRAVREAARSRGDGKGQFEDTAVVLKDFVLHEMQIGMAKEAGADGVYLMSSVLGADLGDYMNCCTKVGLESVVEVHTPEEIERALTVGATVIVVNNWDRLRGTYYPDQAERVIDLIPVGAGVVTALASGRIKNAEEANRLIGLGYHGVVVGGAIMGSTSTPAFIRGVRDIDALPAEFSGWGMEDLENYKDELDQFNV